MKGLDMWERCIRIMEKLFFNLIKFKIMFKVVFKKRSNKIEMNLEKENIILDGRNISPEVSVIVPGITIGNIEITSGTGDDADSIIISVSKTKADRGFNGTIKIASASDKEKPGSTSAGGTPPPVVIVEPEE
jgi:hypothetical protein